MNDDHSEPRADAHPEGAREGWLERLIGRFSHRARDSMRGDLEDAFTEATAAGELSARERLLFQNVLGFHRVRVSDVMVPRADIIAVAADMTLGEVLSLFRTAGHSRLPAYGETLDEPLGMVHIRDFLDFLAGGGEPVPAGGQPDLPASRTPAPLLHVDLAASLTSANILRPVLFVPRSMPAIDLLARMQASRTHMALVIDEYGGTDGLVSIEDLLETVVGDIEDEHDEPEHSIMREEDGVLLADARASLEEVSEAVGHDLATAVSSEEVDTLGGLIVTRAGRVPSRGELIPGPEDLEFEIVDADPRRVKRVRIHRRAAAGAGPGAASAPAANAPERAGPGTAVPSSAVRMRE